jgi:1-phosphofructokinase family hexose kinase
MNILTLTLNPSIDRTLYVRDFRRAALNRTVSKMDNPGSKGINVSRVFRLWGIDAVATGFAGGYTGKKLREYLNTEGVKHSFIETAAETRTNYKIVDIDDESYTEVNEQGGPIAAEELEKLHVYIDSYLEKNDCIFLGGSIPSGVPKDIYDKLILKLAPKGVRIVLDCDGAALISGLKLKPYIIKPNADELSTIAGFYVDNMEDAVNVASNIYREYGVFVLATLGKKGALFASGEGVFTVNAPKVKAKGAAGAGDTFHATFLYHYWGDKRVEYALKAAASAASSRVELEGTVMPGSDGIMKYFDTAKVEKVR